MFTAAELPQAVDGLIGWNRPLFTRSDSSTTEVIDVSDVEQPRYWLLWFTSLPQVQDGLFQVGIREVRFLQ